MFNISDHFSNKFTKYDGAIKEALSDLRSYAGRASYTAIKDAIVSECFRLEMKRSGKRIPKKVILQFAKEAIDWHFRNYSEKKLRSEKQDEENRKQALTNPEQMVEYLNRWRRRLQLLNIRGGLTVKGLSKEEVIDELIHRLTIRLLKVKPGCIIPLKNYERPAVEATYVFLMKTKDRLRNGKSSLPDGKDYRLGFIPHPEEMLINFEKELSIEMTFQNLKEKSSKPQTEWIDGFLLMKKSHSFSDGRLNSSAVAKTLGKNPHSGPKALKKLKATAKKWTLDETLEVIL